eukprot:scaffold68194_cov58-Attheya_sp.AAC.10
MSDVWTNIEKGIHMGVKSRIELVYCNKEAGKFELNIHQGGRLRDIDRWTSGYRIVDDAAASEIVAAAPENSNALAPVPVDQVRTAPANAEALVAVSTVEDAAAPEASAPAHVLPNAYRTNGKV